jgi:benzoate membrane transport protein
MIQNLRDLPRSMAFSAILAALVAVLVGYTGPLLIVVQAAENAGLSQAQLSSWIWGITVGSGVSAIIMSLWYRQPMLAAWPTAGTALLVTSLAQYRYEEAIGAYILAAIGLVILGISGWFGRVIDRVPRAVIAGMLAGVLLRFGINIFTSLGQSQLLVGVMIITYLLLRRLGYRAPSIGTLAVGLLVAGVRGQLQLPELSLQVTTPLLTWPEFTLRAFLGLSVPLFVLANVSQNAPGLAVLRAFDYRTPANGPIAITGLVSLLTAPFGSSGVALSAITAAICVSPEAHPDKDRRYAAGVAYGFWYILFGMFGATAVMLFTGLPRELVAAVAGLALTGALLTALSNAMAEPQERDAALLAFLLTASDITLLGIGAPFWGLLIGVVASYLLRTKS